MKKILIALLVALLYCTGNLHAQSKNETDTAKKTVIIFNSGSTNSSKKRADDFKGIIKISPVAFISGKIPIAYERKISDLFSVQASIGLTTKNYLGALWSDASTAVNDETTVNYDNTGFPAGFDDEVDPLYNFDHRTSKFGYMMSIQPRIYISEEAMDGTFFAIGLSMARFNYSIPGLVAGSGSSLYTGPEKKEFENVKTVMVHFGSQRLYDRLSWEYSAGIGVKNVNGEKYRAGGSNGNFYEAMTPYTKKSDLAFELSVRLGFQL